MATEDGELLWNAVTEALAPIMSKETQLEPNKLEKRVREYFKKGAKNLSFRSKGWRELVDEYADNVFGSLFCGLGDRDWICEADFLLVVDAGVKEQFPASMFSDVPQAQFENVILAASDRAHDDQRYLHLRWEVVQREVQGKVTQKKVGNALDGARVETVKLALPSAEEFVEEWVKNMMEALLKTTQGEPQHILPQEICKSLFDAIVEAGGLPFALTAERGGIPDGVWEYIEVAVEEEYAPLMGAEQAALFEREFLKGPGATDLDSILEDGGPARRKKNNRRAKPY